MTDAERIQRAEAIHLIIQAILAELARAEHLHPIWPGQGRRGDHVLAAAILAEEAGEVVKDTNNYVMHGRGSLGHIHKEAVQTAAMAMRLLLNLEAVERQRINESARRDLQEEHNIYIAGQPITITGAQQHYETLQGSANDSIWWNEEITIHYPIKQENLTLADYESGVD